MTDQFRAMCAELVAAVDLLCGSGYSPRQPVSRLILTVHVEALEELAVRARALLAEPEAEGPSEEELYDLADEFNGDPVPAMRAALARWGRPTPQPKPERVPHWSEGICGDGAAILRDGVMIPIEEVIAELNRRPTPEATND